jgi:cbb3-type cytochrome oxidase cytochrome c subunit
MIHQQQECGMGHVVNFVGVQFGPALNALAGRRTKEWIELQIRNPKRHSPEGMMPSDEIPRINI